MKTLDAHCVRAFARREHTAAASCAPLERYGRCKAPVPPDERCCSVPGAVKKVHHRSLPFNKRWHRKGTTVYARSPLMVPSTAPKLLSCAKYCGEKGSIFRFGNFLPLDTSSWTLESARPTQKS